jgi:hypothetical protein
MALNYSDMESLRTKLVPRCEQSARQYLLYVQGGGGSPSPARVAWCTANITNLPSIAEQLSHYLMSEPGFIGTVTRGADPSQDTFSCGTSITDAAIQSRVEFVLQTYFMPA